MRECDIGQSLDANNEWIERRDNEETGRQREWIILSSQKNKIEEIDFVLFFYLNQNGQDKETPYIIKAPNPKTTKKWKLNLKVFWGFFKFFLFEMCESFRTLFFHSGGRKKDIFRLTVVVAAVFRKNGLYLLFVLFLFY